MEAAVLGGFDAGWGEATGGENEGEEGGHEVGIVGKEEEEEFGDRRLQLSGEGCVGGGAVCEAESAVGEGNGEHAGFLEGLEDIAAITVTKHTLNYK